jgi:PHD/YefM family antitoxin component YafN of YafNO toxin-antitoxin module
MGKVARRLAKTGEPLLLTLDNKPVGVIVSVKDFQERFAVMDAAERRRALMEEIRSDRITASSGVDEVLGELRGR